VEFEQADSINRLIKALSMRHRARAAALLAELNLHPGQEVLLLELAQHGPRTQVQLAHGAGCEPPSITLMVRKLEAGGLVSRSPSPTDGRATIVELTEAGHALVPRLQRAWQSLAEETTADHPLPPEELLQMIWPMVEALGGVPDLTRCPTHADPLGALPNGCVPVPGLEDGAADGRVTR
jgi:DNA-binding MarR family transcriptional regulator